MILCQPNEPIQEQFEKKNVEPIQAQNVVPIKLLKSAQLHSCNESLPEPDLAPSDYSLFPNLKKCSTVEYLAHS